MSSRPPGWIRIKFDHFSIKILSNNELGLQAGFVSNLIIFQLRIHQIMSSRAPGWIHIKFDYFSIWNQSNNGLDSYEI